MNSNEFKCTEQQISDMLNFNHLNIKMSQVDHMYFK